VKEKLLKEESNEKENPDAFIPEKVNWF